MAERHDLGKPNNKLEHFRYEENRLTLGKKCTKNTDSMSSCSLETHCTSSIELGKMTKKFCYFR